MLAENMSRLSKSYAQDMPDWVTAKYFDPAAERQRLLVHDYQQTELKQMRSMDDTKLVDCLEIPPKSFHDLLSSVKYMLENGLALYLDRFFVPFVGDWPTQFICDSLSIRTHTSFQTKITSFLSLAHYTFH